MLPIGHAAAGLVVYTVGKRLNPPGLFSWKMLVFCIVLAGLPDLDCLPVWFLDMPRATTHRTGMHSLLFAVLAGWTFAWGLQRFGSHRYRHLWWLFPLAIATHPVLDLLQMDTTPPLGAQILWPFSEIFVYYPLPYWANVGYLETVLRYPAWLAYTLVLAREMVLGSTAYLLATRLLRLWDARIGLSEKHRRSHASPPLGLSPESE